MLRFEHSWHSFGKVSKTKLAPGLPIRGEAKTSILSAMPGDRGEREIQSCQFRSRTYFVSDHANFEMQATTRHMLCAGGFGFGTP